MQAPSAVIATRPGGFEALSTTTRLLSRLLAYEVDRELVEQLHRPAHLRLLEERSPECVAYVVRGPAEAGWCAEGLDAAAGEFGRLFLSPGSVPPFAGAWLPASGPVGRAHFFDRLRTLVEGRQAVSEDPLERPPSDHLALVLAIAAERLESSSRELQATGRSLLRELLAVPGRRFALALERSTVNPLYRTTGTLLRDLLERA